MSTPSGDRPGDGPAQDTAAPTTPDEIRADIEATREQLGRTAAAHVDRVLLRAS